MKEKGLMAGGSLKVERKVVEKNRRMQMKSLLLKLSSLIPKQEIINASKPDYLEEAATYINNLKERVEQKKKKRDLMALDTGSGMPAIEKQQQPEAPLAPASLPTVEVRRKESAVEVVMITGAEQRYMFHEAISVLEQEGAEVVNASFATVGDKAYHTIHSKAVPTSRIGMEGSRACERLRELLQ